MGKAISCSTAKEILLVEILQHRREPGNSMFEHHANIWKTIFKQGTYD